MSAKDNLAMLIKKRYEQQGETLSDEEAEEASQNLVGYFDLLAELDWKNRRQKMRLEKEPDGFPVDDQYSCLVCGRQIDATNGWYHHGGPRCVICHKAILGGTVPSFVLWAHDSYFKTWQLKEFGLHPATARKYVREGRLRARIIMGENGRPYEYIFLKKENPELAACEKWNPVYKSQKRHRDKVNAAYARKEKGRPSAKEKM